MTETRTTRFGQPQWSSGTDSGSRTDFNEGYLALETRAAYDDGVTTSALPVSGVVQGRYAWVNAAGNYRTLYRRDDATTWYPVGGPTIPTTQLHRGLVAPVLTDVDADAIRVEHPLTAALGGWGANITYAGRANLRSALVLGSSASAALGVLAVGGGTAPAAGIRAIVRASETSEHALVVSTSAMTTPGDLLRLIDNAASPVLRVDGTGSLVAARPAAFGGSAIPTTAAVGVAPTTGEADGLTVGLLLQGLAGSAALQAKTILSVLRDAADTAPIVTVDRDNILIGRQPWGTLATTGRITLAANRHVLRSSGNASNATYFSWGRTDPTSPATEANPALDTTLFNAGPNGFGMTLPLNVSQRNKTNLPTMSLYRLTDFGAALLDVARIVPDGVGGETVQLAGSWKSDGRLAAGAWWRSTGTLRDARQPVIHKSFKRYTPFGDPPTTGTFVNPLATLTYTWPTMTLRSVTDSDLKVVTAVEYMFDQNSQQRGQSVATETFISINGGAFNACSPGITEEATVSAVNSTRHTGGNLIGEDFAVAIPAGATFQLRTRFGPGDGSVGLWVRAYNISATECVVENYAAA
jgi:hypothetical protein